MAAGSVQTEWAFEGRPNVFGQVGAPEWTSVTKVGVCWYAQSGRINCVKPGGTAEVFDTALLSQRTLGQKRFLLSRTQI